jgi:hypothetical protein
MKKLILLSIVLFGGSGITSNTIIAQSVGGYWEAPETCTGLDGITVMKCRPMPNGFCNVSGQVPCGYWAEILK